MGRQRKCLGSQDAVGVLPWPHTSGRDPLRRGARRRSPWSRCRLPSASPRLGPAVLGGSLRLLPGLGHLLSGARLLEGVWPACPQARGLARGGGVRCRGSDLKVSAGPAWDCGEETAFGDPIYTQILALPCLGEAGVSSGHRGLGKGVTGGERQAGSLGSSLAPGMPHMKLWVQWDFLGWVATALSISLTVGDQDRGRPPGRTPWRFVRWALGRGTACSQPLAFLKVTGHSHSDGGEGWAV